MVNFIKAYREELNKKLQRDSFIRIYRKTNE